MIRKEFTCDFCMKLGSAEHGLPTGWVELCYSYNTNSQQEVAEISEILRKLRVSWIHVCAACRKEPKTWQKLADNFHDTRNQALQVR